MVNFDDEVSLSEESSPEIVIVSGAFSIDPSERCSAGLLILVIVIIAPKPSAQASS